MTSADTVTVPHSVYQSLKAGAITGNAGNLLGMLRLNATSGLPRVVHPGDSFGRIVAWMWTQDREETMLLLADFLAELRDHHALSGDVTPPVSLAEVAHRPAARLAAHGRGRRARRPDRLRPHEGRQLLRQASLITAEDGGCAG